MRYRTHNARSRIPRSLHAQGGAPVVVVVSALSKVTDLILSVLNSARTGNGKQMEDGLLQLQARHEQVVAELFSGSTKKAVAAEVQSTLHRLRELSSALLLLGSATAQVMDMLINFKVEQEDTVYPMVAAGASLHEMIRRPSPIVETAADE